MRVGRRLPLHTALKLDLSSARLAVGLHPTASSNTQYIHDNTHRHTRLQGEWIHHENFKLKIFLGHMFYKGVYAIVV
jgi:hypothetical protein